MVFENGFGATGTGIKLNSFNSTIYPQDVMIKDNTVMNNKAPGIEVAGAIRFKICGNYIKGNLYGISIDDLDNVIPSDFEIESNYIYLNRQYGIKISNGTRGRIINNKIWDNAEGYDGYDAVRATATYITFELNQIYDSGSSGYAQRDGILMDSGCANWTIKYNDFTNFGARNAITISGSGHIIKYNDGFITENSGTATVANGEYIAHGLASSLNIGQSNSSVLITEYTKVYDGVPVTVGCDFVNATHFRVAVYWTNGTAITDDTIQIWWQVEYTG